MTAPVLPRDPDDPRYGEVIRRFQAGETQASIAADMGVTQASLSRWLIHRGYRRDRSEAERLKWERMSPDQRSAQVAAAHTARRGAESSLSELERRARGKEGTQAHVTEEERELARWLADRGIDTTMQKAAGPYNIDLAAAGAVAVELFGGGWHGHGLHAERLPKRSRYLLDQGWHLYIVWTHRVHPLGPEVTDDMVAFIERASSDPASVREYRVIWGDGKLVAVGCADDDELTLIPAGIRGTYART